MAKLSVGNNMWPILLFSICLAFSKFSLAASLTYNNVNPQFEGPHISSDICPQLETLQRILVQLKRLMNQNDLYAVQPDKRIQILQALKQHLERTQAQVNEKYNKEKLEELLFNANSAALVENMHNQNNDNDIKAKFIFKYEIPNINNVDCKEAVAILIQAVRNAHQQVINFCNQSGKCNLHTDSGVSYEHDNDADIHGFLKSSSLFNNPVQIQSLLKSLNQNSLNMHNLKYINNQLKSENEMLNQIRSNNFLNTPVFPNSYLNGYKYPFTGSINSDIDETLNNRENNQLFSQNTYSNKQLQQSNILHSDKSDILKSMLNSQIPAQIKITPSNQNSLNIYRNERPLNFPQNIGHSNNFLQSREHLEPNLNVGQFVATGHYNKGIVQSKYHNNNELTANYNHLMQFNNNGKLIEDDRRNFNNPIHGFNDFQRANYPLSILQSLNVKKEFQQNYNNNLNNQMSYDKLLQLSGGFQDKSLSVNMANQNNQNINDNAQYDGIRQIPGNRFNFFSLGNPNEIMKIGNDNLLTSNHEHHFDKFDSNVNLKQNFNNNNLYYNSQQADAFIRNNFGSNPYASTTSVDYPYSANSMDLYRFASLPHSAKLTSPDNDGIVELTYKLKRPEPINQNAYYYAKFRMPYKDFISKMNDLSKNSHLRSNPMKVHEELLALSNLVESSADLRNIESSDVSKLVLENGSELINANVLGTNDLNADKYLKTIQNLNANLKTNDILNLFENYKNYKTYTNLDSYTPIYRPDPYPYEKELPLQNGNFQYFPDIEPRRLYFPIVQYDPKLLKNPFLTGQFSKTYPITEKNYKSNAGVYSYY